MTDWKPWTMHEVYAIDKDTIIQVRFSDGVLGEPTTLQNWMNVQYAPTSIIEFKVWENEE